MGNLVNNVCYPTIQEARKAYCSTFDLSQMEGTSFYTATCNSTAFSTANMNVCVRLNGGGCLTRTQPYPTMPTCDHDGGITLAYDWFIASIAFLVIVWGGKKLIQLFDTHHLE